MFFSSLPNAVSSATARGKEILASHFDDPSSAHSALDSTERSLHKAFEFAASLLDASANAAQASLREQGATNEQSSAAATKLLLSVPEIATLADACAVCVQLARPLAASSRNLSTFQLYRAAQALAVLHKRCAAAFDTDLRPFVASDSVFPLPSAPELGRLARLAHAVYGNDPATLSTLVPNASLLHFQAVANLCLPAHALLVDEERREILVLIRGTASFSDVLTDLVVESLPLHDHEASSTASSAMAHAGMLKSAKAIDSLVRPLVRDALEHVSDDFRIVLCGHSLGAGCAALLAELWHIERPFPQRHAISAVCFGAPCVLSLSAARAAAPRTLSVVCDDDIVSRASCGTVGDMARALACLAHCRISTSSDAAIDTAPLLARALVAAETSHVIDSENAESELEVEADTQSLSAHVLALDAAAADCETNAARLEHIATTVHAFVTSHRREQADYLAQRLFAPGRVLSLQSAVEERESDQLHLGRVVLSASMLVSHAASNYERACMQRIAE